MDNIVWRITHVLHCKKSTYLLFLTANMSGEEMAGGGAVIGMLDLVVIGGVVAVVAYYFVRKRKQEAVPEMKKLTVM